MAMPWETRGGRRGDARQKSGYIKSCARLLSSYTVGATWRKELFLLQRAKDEKDLKERKRLERRGSLTSTASAVSATSHSGSATLDGGSSATLDGGSLRQQLFSKMCGYVFY